MASPWGSRSESLFVCLATCMPIHSEFSPWRNFSPAWGAPCLARTLPLRALSLTRAHEIPTSAGRRQNSGAGHLFVKSSLCCMFIDVMFRYVFSLFLYWSGLKIINSWLRDAEIGWLHYQMLAPTRSRVCSTMFSFRGPLFRGLLSISIYCSIYVFIYQIRKHI